MIWDVNYNKLVQWLTPPVLRSPLMTAWLKALVWPVVQAYQQWRRLRDANLYKLGITPQVCYLEKMLNDRFDPGDRRIYIRDAEDRPPLWLYRAAENKPLRLGSSPLYTSGETSALLNDFVVYVPAGMMYETAEMRQLLSIYKLAATRYTIQTF